MASPSAIAEKRRECQCVSACADHLANSLSHPDLATIQMNAHSPAHTGAGRITARTGIRRHVHIAASNRRSFNACKPAGENARLLAYRGARLTVAMSQQEDFRLDRSAFVQATRDIVAARKLVRNPALFTANAEANSALTGEERKASLARNPALTKPAPPRSYPPLPRPAETTATSIP